MIKSTSIGYQGISINIGNKNGIGKPFSNVGTPLSKQFIRQAFELSLDRNVINRVVFGGTVVPGCLPVPKASPYYDASIKCPGRNLAKARELLRKAGARPPVAVKLMIGTDQVQARLGQVIQSMASEAGFRVELQPTEFVTALARQDRGQYDAFAVGWSGRVDPDGNIYQFVDSKGSLNNLGWSTPRMDLLLDNAPQGDVPRREEEALQQRVQDPARAAADHRPLASGQPPRCDQERERRTDLRRRPDPGLLRRKDVI